jgi:hypothetical protein
MAPIAAAMATVLAAPDELQPERPVPFPALLDDFPPFPRRDWLQSLSLPLGDQGMDMGIQPGQVVIVQAACLRHDLM